MEGLLGLEYAVLFSTIFKNLGSHELLSLRTQPPGRAVGSGVASAQHDLQHWGCGVIQA